MRLIELHKTEKEVFVFSSFLNREGIVNTYEPKGLNHYALWIEEEDDLEVAQGWLEKYLKDPEDKIFHETPPLLAEPLPPLKKMGGSERPLPIMLVKPARFKLRLTHLIIILCTFLFLWNDAQEAEVLQEKGPMGVRLGMVPLQTKLLFDYPQEEQKIQEIASRYPLKTYETEKEFPPELQAQLKAAEQIPVYRGFPIFLKVWMSQGWHKAASVPLFEKISEGEVWRLFTPCLLHSDFLHILFNMIWVWILTPQIESRLKGWKLIVLILLLGVVSNVFQYLMSGPYFIGFSGIVVGLVGFIWMRQQKAPWEGYPLNRATILFLLVFVLSMVALEGMTFFMQVFSMGSAPLKIANTAHIVGGLTGIVLGKSSFFARGST